MSSDATPIRFHLGTHRAVPPSETVARARRLMSVMGITRVANVTGLDCIGIPVVMVCRPNSRGLAVSQGKGADLLSAQASGLMEAVESYHAERPALPLRLASVEELRYRRRVVDVAALPRVRGSRLDPHRPLHWVEGYDLLGDTSVWLPFDLVHTAFTVAMRRLHDGFVLSSNGLASGNHILEAVSHGICEVVERDALTLWRLRSAEARAATRVDLASVSDPLCGAVLDRYERAGVAAQVWDITSDVGIPAYLCHVASDDHLWLPLPAEGLGCHPSPAIALLRALVEAAQSRLTLIAGARDDITHEHYGDAGQMWREADGVGATPTRAFDPDATPTFATLEAEVAWELERLRGAGLESVIVVDLTRPEFGLPVVRVVIPGLEASSSLDGYTPGPRAARWRDGRP